MKTKHKIIVLAILAILATTSLAIFGGGSVFSQTKESRPSVNSRPVFCRMSNEQTEHVRNIVLADQRIQDIIEGQEYEFTVQGHIIRGTLWHLDVGAVLKDGVSTDEIKRWRNEGRPAGDLISEIVGVLYVGHNATYYLTIDSTSDSLAKIEASIVTNKPTPELTIEERQQVVEITLEDPRIQELLKDKQYTVVPDSVCIWHIDREKIGAGLEIRLDQAYEIEYAWPWPEIDKLTVPDFPYYKVMTYPGTFKVNTLVILVDLNRQEVVGIQRGPIMD